MAGKIAARGLLIDLDGVLYVEDEPIAGAQETIVWLRGHGIPFRFITNTTMRSRRTLTDKLQAFGIDAKTDEIFSTCVVAASWLSARGIERVHLLLPDDPKHDFEGFIQTDDQPQAVVVGDLAEGFTYGVLNHAFRLLKGGAQLVALQKNRFWQTADGLSMDAGPFVAALEYAAEVEAMVVGKPNPAYFEMALRDMGLQPEEVAMIGDDVSTDIAGAKRAGLTAILPQTGKFRQEHVGSAEIKPDVIIESIADLPELLKAVG